MTNLAYFDADADSDDVLTTLREDGACVLVDVMSDEILTCLTLIMHGISQRIDFVRRNAVT